MIPTRTRAAVIDLRFLQDRRGYHQIPREGIAKAFLESQYQPAQGTPLPELLQHGHFRRAGEAALTALFQAPPDDADRVLQLLHIRLVCLVLINHAERAADEAIPLTDFLARGTPEAQDLLPSIPWELRLLLVRLQSIGANDGGRRGIMALYALAGEVRAQVKEARSEYNDDESQIWSDRLCDLGLRVADSLVEMGELDTANRHLETLVNAPVDEVFGRRALLRARGGDIADAQHCIDRMEDKERKSVFQVGSGRCSDEYPPA